MPVSSPTLNSERDRNLKYLKEAKGINAPRASTDSKVDKKGRRVSFGLLPHVTCPGRTEFCTSCYVASTYRYPNVPKVLAENTRVMLDCKTTDEMVECLQAMLNKSDVKKVGQFRIHWSGDFFNQVYLDAWKQVARNSPEVTFWAYTRSFHLNFHNIPDNLIIFASGDKHNLKEAMRFSIKYGFPGAFAGTEEEVLATHMMLPICPHLISQVKDCLTCGKCQAKQPVFFRLHR